MKLSFAPLTFAAVAAIAACAGFSNREVEAAPQATIIGGTTATAADYPSVGKLTAGSALCTATLVSPKWVLTAAHCVQGVAANKVKFVVGGKTYVASQVAVHPNYNPAAFSMGYDLALVQLSAPVANVKPAILSTKVPKAKAQVTIVGFGRGGTGTTGQTGGSGTKRYGYQVIDQVAPQHIYWSFDSNETSSIAQGDSGGPAFLKGTSTVISVASGVTVGAGGKIGVHGTWAFETRVDANLAWCKSVMK